LNNQGIKKGACESHFKHFENMVATSSSSRSVSFPSLLVNKLRSAQATAALVSERQEDDQMFLGSFGAYGPSTEMSSPLGDIQSFVEYVHEETSPRIQSPCEAVSSTTKAKKAKKGKCKKGTNKCGDRIRKINCARAKGAGDVVRICIKQLGWMAIESDLAREATFDLRWLGATGADTDIKVRDEVQALQPKQLLSRLPGMASVSRKAELHRQLQRVQCLCPDHFTHFVPKAWVFPKQRKEFELEMKRAKKRSSLNGGGWFIAKPDGGSQGDGIFLSSKLRDYDVS
jgi:hypothetical protein